MEIISATYTYDIAGNRDGINTDTHNGYLGVPIDPANRHYAEIMRKVDEEGLVIAEPD